MQGALAEGMTLSPTGDGRRRELPLQGVLLPIIPPPSSVPLLKSPGASLAGSSGPFRRDLLFLFPPHRPP